MNLNQSPTKVDSVVVLYGSLSIGRYLLYCVKRESYDV